MSFKSTPFRWLLVLVLTCLFSLPIATGVSIAAGPLDHYFPLGIRVAFGTVSNPGIGFIGDEKTGFYLIGASNIGLSLGGAVKYNFGSNTFGIGVTPKAWYASYSVMQIGGKGALFTETTPAAGSGLYIVENAYLDAGNAWKHIINDETARIQTVNGTIALSAGVAGAADSAITWETLASFALDGAATFYFNNVAKGFTTAQGWGIVTHTPANAGATGTAGTIAWDANFLYICSAANTWLRVAIATW